MNENDLQILHMQLNTGFEGCETHTPMGLLVLLLCVEHPDWQADTHTTPSAALHN